MATAQDILDVMRGWLGESSHRTIIDIYNAHTPLAVGHRMTMQDAWCDATVSAAFIQCNAVDAIGGTECGVERHIQLFKKAGIWEEDGTVTPEPGWIITFNWDDKTQPNDGFADHIGIVESVVGSTVNTIEGNSNGRVARCSYAVSHGNIRGYAKPKYGEQIKPAERNYLLAADVSEYQGVIDWEKFSKAVDLVIIRAYNGSRADKQWERNVAMAEKYKVPYGVYMFSQARTAADSKQENIELIKMLAGHHPQYPVYLDKENTATVDYGRTARLVAEQFYADLSAAGYVPGLYTGWYFYDKYLDGVKTDSLWMASYGTNDGNAQEGSRPPYNLDGWQFTSVARVDGVTENTVDLSRWYKRYTSAAPTRIEYKAHCQKYGWQPWKHNGEWAGTTGEGKRLEALVINPPECVELEVTAHLQGIGDKVYKGITHGNNVIIGTVGESRRIEGIRIKCVQNPTGKRLYYQVHCQTYGDLPVCTDGEFAGTRGQSKRMEAIRIGFN